MNKLYVVGIGPGEKEQMTLKALHTLEKAEVIAGYGVYVDLVKELFPEKEYLVTPMRREADRCRMAIDAALEGKSVAVISSGDAGVYGMAGLVLELAEGKDVTVEVISGVTAALSGGAVLGAPLTHDFAVISLSDLLTPWEKIEKRLLLAARADFGIALYNPSSHRRADYLRRACEIILTEKPEQTVCGVVRNIGREGESMEVMTLGQLKDYKADMFSTVFIGNSQTREISGRMVTPRGYKDV
ncbi:MAG: precorrin-3B C(17)-methyltransferase [Oscillospiraceae bacterium]|nr:precorrin-3B C(17)-methyltransferase [Oscillospiraceae bacterium]